MTMEVGDESEADSKVTNVEEDYDEGGDEDKNDESLERLGGKFLDGDCSRQTSPSSWRRCLPGTSGRGTQAATPWGLCPAGSRPETPQGMEEPGSPSSMSRRGSRGTGSAARLGGRWGAGEGTQADRLGIGGTSLLCPEGQSAPQGQ